MQELEKLHILYDDIGASMTMNFMSVPHKLRAKIV